MERTRNIITILLLVINDLQIIPHKPFEEVILYCIDFVEADEIEKKMKQACLFVEAGPDSLYHGKYPHLLQLSLIGLAQKYRILMLSTPLETLIKTLVTDDKWNDTLDSFEPNRLCGPASINIIVLSRLGFEFCPKFHQYFSYAYIKKIRREESYFNMRFYFPGSSRELPKWNVENFREYVERCITHPNITPQQPLPLQKDDYLFRHNAGVVEGTLNLYKKRCRDPSFSRIAAKILACV